MGVPHGRKKFYKEGVPNIKGVPLSKILWISQADTKLFVRASQGECCVKFHGCESHILGVMAL